jgi:hypothetical protein
MSQSQSPSALQNQSNIIGASASTLVLIPTHASHSKPQHETTSKKKKMRKEKKRKKNDI